MAKIKYSIIHTYLSLWLYSIIQATKRKLPHPIDCTFSFIWYNENTKERVTMYKLIAFDLDNTLAAVGKAVIPEDVAALRELERRGARIALCSGKPTYYLCGFARQLGLKQPILVGENGAVIQFGVDLPPKQYYTLPYSSEAAHSIHLLRDTIVSRLPQMWFQPNITALTPFPTCQGDFDAIEDAIASLEGKLKDVIIYRHFDSYDVMPCGITKGSGLAYLGKLMGIASEETIAVGDGVNDYPMFEYAGLSLGVSLKEPERADRNFETSSQMLQHLLELFH